MFKSYIYFIAAIGAVMSSSAFAAGENTVAEAKKSAGIIVSSQVRNLSAMAVGNEISYTKTFDVTLVNSSDEPLNLKTGCFKAVMPDKSEQTVDTIERILTRGMLQKGASVKGFVGFAAKDENIYKASAVKFVPVCP
ncbi:MAG: DUF4354 family protein [Brucellaceae bacterium]|jgi:hypothetical protein|nr:DUF4354 family protein [Brucellaceae bacterium]